MAGYAVPPPQVSGREHLAENSDFVSGEHDARRGGTTKSAVEPIS